MGRILTEYKKLFDSVRKGDIQSIYFLYGQEEFLKKEFISEIIKAVLPERNRVFNLDIFHGDEFDRNAFDDRMLSFPLFSENRLVILKRFEDLTAANKKYTLERVQKIPDSLVFIVESGRERLDTAPSKALKKVAEEHGIAFQFKHLSEDETLTRVKGRFRREGFDIDQDALELLVDLVGTQLSDLINEVEKIALHADGEAVVTREMVKDVVGRYRTENLFDLLDLLTCRGDMHIIVQKLNRLLYGGNEPVVIIAMLLKRVIQLLQVKSLMEESGPRLSTQALALKINRSAFYAGKLVNQSERFEKAELELLLENLRWADLTLKTSSIDPKQLLEEVFFASFVRKKLATYADII